jgi:hypothetical protein
VTRHIISATVHIVFVNDTPSELLPGGEFAGVFVWSHQSERSSSAVTCKILVASHATGESSPFDVTIEPTFNLDLTYFKTRSSVLQNSSNHTSPTHPFGPTSSKRHHACHLGRRQGKAALALHHPLHIALSTMGGHRQRHG